MFAGVVLAACCSSRAAPPSLVSSHARAVTFTPARLPTLRMAEDGASSEQEPRVSAPAPSVAVYLSVGRLAQVGLTSAAAYGGYIVCGEFLDAALVESLGISRSEAGDLFGPFVTLLSLIYSIILSQIYSYQFNRQGAIQNALYQEAAALSTLQEVIESMSVTYPETVGSYYKVDLLRSLHRHTSTLLETGFNSDELDDARTSIELLKVAAVLERESQGRSPATMGIASSSIARIDEERAKRLSAVSGQLPPVQTITQKIISSVILLGWLLVDFGVPKLEALLFAVIAGTFTLIQIFIDDLANPFGGIWSVEPARRKIIELSKSLDQDALDVGEAEEAA